MQTRTSIGLVAAFTAGMALVPMSAKAICQQTIRAEHSFSDGTNTQVLGHVTTTDPFTYFASTTNAVISNLIFAAVANRNTVLIIGDAAGCPPPPTTVPVPAGTALGMGTILQIFQQP
jgi:hypothetical protein